MSGAGGGGKGGTFSSLNSKTFSGGGNFFENLGSDIGNYVTQYVTGGLVSYQDGKFGAGANPLLQGAREGSGQGAAQRATIQAGKELESTQKKNFAARILGVKQIGKEESNRSTTAAAARNTAAQTSNADVPNAANVQDRALQSTSTLGSDEQDFLGL